MQILYSAISSNYNYLCSANHAVSDLKKNNERDFKTIAIPHSCT